MKLTFYGVTVLVFLMETAHSHQVVQPKLIAN